MSKTKFTPGPWHITKATHDGEIIQIRDVLKGPGSLEVETRAEGPTNWKTARLISVAPEMYSKLDAIVLRLTELNTANALPNDRRLNTLIREGFDLLQKIEGTDE